LLDQQTCLLSGCLGFRCGITLGVDEGRYQRDLNVNLLTAQCWGWPQCNHQVKRTRELLHRFR
jgi:hypothetical protein